MLSQLSSTTRLLAIIFSLTLCSLILFAFFRGTTEVFLAVFAVFAALAKDVLSQFRDKSISDTKATTPNTVETVTKTNITSDPNPLEILPG